MQLGERLRNALKIGARDFSHALDCFDPRPGRDNSYPERMVSSSLRPGSRQGASRVRTCSLEIAIAGESGRESDNHVDALVFNDHKLVVARNSRFPGHPVTGYISHGISERLRGPVAKQIRTGFAVRGRRPFIFLGTDCWHRGGADAWKAGTKFGKWILPESMHTYRRDYVCVDPDKGRDFDGYYLTWALIPFRGILWLLNRQVFVRRGIQRHGRAADCMPSGDPADESPGVIAPPPQFGHGLPLT